jgi:hypothetical protein
MSSMRVIYRSLSLTKTSEPLPVTMPRRKAAQRATTIGPSTIDIDLMNTPFCRVSASRPQVSWKCQTSRAWSSRTRLGTALKVVPRVRRPQRASRSRRRWLRGSPTRLSKDVPDHWRAPFDFISFKAWISWCWSYHPVLAQHASDVRTVEYLHKQSRQLELLVISARSNRFEPAANVVHRPPHLRYGPFDI